MQSNLGVASVSRRSIRFDNEIFVLSEMKLVCTVLCCTILGRGVLVPVTLQF